MGFFHSTDAEMMAAAAAEGGADKAESSPVKGANAESSESPEKVPYVVHLKILVHAALQK